MKPITRGEMRKRLEVELQKQYGMKITKAQIKKTREIAAKLA